MAKNHIKLELQAEMIRYRNGGALALLLRMPDGRYLEVPIYGLNREEILNHYELNTSESHETYEHVTAKPKTGTAEKEEQS